MGLLLACKNEEDPIKNEGARVVTTLFINFSDTQGQLTPKSVMESCRNSNPSKLLWLVLLSARIKKNQSKMKELKWSQDFPHYNPMGAICWMKKIHPKMKVLEWSQHFSHFKSMWIFPDAQGQLTHKSLVRSCRISNPFEILWLSLLPARIKENQSKMKELEWSQDFPHYNPMEAIFCHGTRVLIRSNWKPNAVNHRPQWFFWWNLIMIGKLVSEILMFESEDKRTDAGSNPIL